MTTKSTQQTQTQQQPEKPTKELSFGARVGRGITKLSELNEAEKVELATSPEAIRSKFSKRRSALLDEMDPQVKAAVLAAATVSEVKAAE